MLPARMPAEPPRWPLARPDLEGFHTRGSHGQPCLLLHGFTAAPSEMRPLAEALSARGFPVTVLRLPGHGTHVDELAAVRPSDWLESAEGAMERLAPAGPVLLAGQSMGALLALLIAARRTTTVAAVAALAAPLWFADWRARTLLPVLRYSGLTRLVRFLPKAPSALSEEARRRHFTYDRFPVKGLLGLSSLMREAWRALPEVRVPLLVVHGRHDATAPPAGARLLFDRAGSDTKELVWMDKSRHVLTHDIQSGEVCARVGAFFEAVSGAGSPPASSTR